MSILALFLAASAIGQPVPPNPIMDERPWLAVMCRFSDYPTYSPRTAEQVVESFSIQTEYWDTMSDGLLQVTTHATGWRNLSNPKDHYKTVTGSVDLINLLTDCANLFAADYDLNQYAGFFILTNKTVNSFSYGGRIETTIDGVRRIWRSVFSGYPHFIHPALVSHEMGHTFGLSHSNNEDGDTDTYDNPWDIMSDFNNYAVYISGGRRPKSLAGFQRHFLGWSPYQELVTRGEHTRFLNFFGKAYGAGVETLRIENGGRQWVIEARNREYIGDKALPGVAVLVYELKWEGRVGYLQDASVPPATYSNNEGVMFKPGEYHNFANWSLSVLNQTENGFTIQVTLDDLDTIFRDGFD